MAAEEPVADDSAPAFDAVLVEDTVAVAPAPMRAPEPEATPATAVELPVSKKTAAVTRGDDSDEEEEAWETAEEACEEATEEADEEAFEVELEEATEVLEVLEVVEVGRAEASETRPPVTSYLEAQVSRSMPSGQHQVFPSVAILQ